VEILWRKVKLAGVGNEPSGFDSTQARENHTAEEKANGIVGSRTNNRGTDRR
jgi:hypothetical protein